MANLISALGLMSGTSMDGIDVALIHTDGENIVEHGPTATYSFDDQTRSLLTQAMRDATTIRQRIDRPGCLVDAEKLVTRLHVSAVESFFQENALSDSDVNIIGFHGQTVIHRPNEALTVQLGDGQAMADQLQIPVCFDLRANDMLHGGQGAPLVPVYHRALARQRPAIFVNIGGISNITYIGSDGSLLAFDCGPGNALLDDWMGQHGNVACDVDGKTARSGTIDEDVLNRYLQHPFFARPVPRSLDRADFTLDHAMMLDEQTGAATLTELTAKSIRHAADWLPEPAKTWFICGGGRLNRYLMQRLAYHIEALVAPVEACGLNGDAIEAEAFAYLAVRSLKGLPITFPGTTGADKACCGGVIVEPA